MSDKWLGICVPTFGPQLKRALHSVDARARLEFVESPAGLRQRVQESRGPVGVIVGPLQHGGSGLNVAATIAKDAIAASVVLVGADVSEEWCRRAREAGVNTVLDARRLDGGQHGVDDLDEPVEYEATVMAIPASARRRASLVRAVPQVEVPGAEDPSDDSHASLPFVTADEHGIKLLRGTGRQPAGVTGSKGDAALSHGQSVGMAAREEANALPSIAASVPEVSSLAKDAMPDGVIGGDVTIVQEAPSREAPIITFVSGRGGVGKTTLVAAMACVAASWGMRVGMCDLDLTAGNLYAAFGMRGPADLAPIATDGMADEALVSGCGIEVSSGLTLWGPCALPEMADTVTPQVRRLLQVASRQFDVVLVDTSHTFTDAVAQAAQLCDRFVVVVDGMPGSAVSQARLGALAVRLGVARTRVVRLANRCGSGGRGEPDINRADVGMETARPLRVSEGGQDVCDFVSEGKVGELLDVGSHFADSVASCMAILLSELGCLPDKDAARRALEDKGGRVRWLFGRRRAAS